MRERGDREGRECFRLHTTGKITLKFQGEPNGLRFAPCRGPHSTLDSIIIPVVAMREYLRIVHLTTGRSSFERWKLPLRAIHPDGVCFINYDRKSVLRCNFQAVSVSIVTRG